MIVTVPVHLLGGLMELRRIAVVVLLLLTIVVARQLRAVIHLQVVVGAHPQIPRILQVVHLRVPAILRAAHHHLLGQVAILVVEVPAPQVHQVEAEEDNMVGYIKMKIV